MSSSLRASFLFFATAVAVLYLAVIGLGIAGFFYNKQRAEEGREAHDYACAQRAFQQRSINAQNIYISEVQRGVRELIDGVTLNDIRISRERTQASLDSTDFIDC